MLVDNEEKNDSGEYNKPRLLKNSQTFILSDSPNKNKTSSKYNNTCNDSIEINFQELIDEREKLPPPVINPEKDPYSGINLFNNLLDSNYAYATYDRSNSINDDNNNLSKNKSTYRRPIEKFLNNDLKESKDLDDVAFIEVTSNLLNNDQDLLISPLNPEIDSKNTVNSVDEKTEYKADNNKTNKTKNPYKWIMEEFEDKRLDKVKRTLLVTLDDISKGYNRRSRSVSMTRTPYYNNHIPQTSQQQNSRNSRKTNENLKVANSAASYENQNQHKEKVAQNTYEDDAYLVMVQSKSLDSDLGETNSDIFEKSIEIEKAEAMRNVNLCQSMQRFGCLKNNGSFFSKSLNEKASLLQNKLKNSNSQFSLLNSFPSHLKNTSELSKPPHPKQTFSTATIVKKKNVFNDSVIKNIIPASDEAPPVKDKNNIQNKSKTIGSSSENIIDQKKYESFCDVQVIAKMQEESLRQSMLNLNNTGSSNNINLINEFKNNSRRLNESTSATKISNKMMNNNPKYNTITKSTTMFNYNTNQAPTLNYNSSNFSTLLQRTNPIKNNNSSRPPTPSRNPSSSITNKQEYRHPAVKSNDVESSIIKSEVTSPKSENQGTPSGRRLIQAYGSQRSATTSIVPMIGGKSVFSTPSNTNNKTSWQKKKMTKIQNETVSNLQEQHGVYASPKFMNNLGECSDSTSSHLTNNSYNEQTHPSRNATKTNLDRKVLSNQSNSSFIDGLADILKKEENEIIESRNSAYNKIQNHTIRKSFLPQPVQNRLSSVSPIRQQNRHLSPNWKDGCY